MIAADQLSALADSHDIISLGMAADEVRRRRHGTRVTFLRVADIDPTPGAPVVVPPTAGEVRIVGTPATRAEAIARVREVAAAGARPLSAYSLADLQESAAQDGVTLRSLLEELKAAGLDSIAEAPFDLVKDAPGALADVKGAGLGLARLTIHQLQEADPLNLYQDVATLQRAVDGEAGAPPLIRAVAPLPRRMNPAVPTTGFDDVKRVALARLCLDDAVSIQVDWSLYGAKLAQVALTMGADDVDGVTAIDDQSEGRRRAPLEEVRRNIVAAGLEPVERDGRFGLRA